MNWNSVQIAGRLGADPELRYLQNGTAVCDLNLATTRTWNSDSGQKNEETTWVQVTFWGRSAETVAQYFGKGGAIFVAGRLKQDTWEDRKTGQKRSKLTIVGERWQFCGDSGNGSQPEPASRREQDSDDDWGSAEYDSSEEEEDEDDIPF